MSPPPAEPFASRIFLGPALRAQPDRRLVRLVREGYETAFEEIVRRYRRPLDRFAASIVGSRSEDVTQDAFSKALLALRGSENEIELKPWLYRIVRNTALNDLRDRPPTVEQLEETLAGGESAAVEVERREEMTELMERLRALPEPQRAALVMRELEGLSHDEIAAALGVSGGAARQAIHRARTSLRNGIGLLLPLPLLRTLFDHGAEAAGGAAAASAAGVATASGAGLGGIGAGGAVKAGLATVLIAGSVGAAGVAIQHERSANGGPDTAEAAVGTGRVAEDSGGPQGSSGSGSSGELEPGDDRGGHGEAEPGDDRSGDDRRGSNRGEDNSGHGGSGGDDRSGQAGGGEIERHGDRSGSSGHGGSGSSGSPDSGSSGNSGSGSSGSGSGESEGVAATPVDDSSGSGSGSDSSGSGSSGSDGSDSSGSGSGDD